MKFILDWFLNQESQICQFSQNKQLEDFFIVQAMDIHSVKHIILDWVQVLLIQFYFNFKRQRQENIINNLKFTRIKKNQQNQQKPFLNIKRFLEVIGTNRGLLLIG
ncbi:hypothetical protein TTHERM_001325791 (macronuclear) [Tetrahymena thermophila SB210]|uniref:Uncharacterized protein n=1 Tax=Tetrahymena thermophila (strain SB210) TaxID=312017 RepID=W7XBU0_TETTS|nr:hypothetical protein TTHERM_001325791 [Tetrahymena thermophila SB210]EWS71151.1 hypothetical protein TTHERM_001325791 [Tetrahymena thermophila SB210]|eukprot:XP_012656315.1 hypothetical protein TTHERM_001325791 [Tetrahymena thermophila SB210]